MKHSRRLTFSRALVCASIFVSAFALADFEVTGPDGKRILLMDNGTWRYMEAEDKGQETAKEKAKDEGEGEGEAVLTLEGKVATATGCRFVVQLVNNLTYMITGLVPNYAAYRANGLIYDTVSAPSGFVLLKPGDKQVRAFEIRGLGCQEIARVQVVGGDRCEMGKLNKWSDAKGKCLARVRVVESDLVRFDK